MENRIEKIAACFEKLMDVYFGKLEPSTKKVAKK